MLCIINYIYLVILQKIVCATHTLFYTIFYDIQHNLTILGNKVASHLQFLPKTPASAKNLIQFGYCFWIAWFNVYFNVQGHFLSWLGLIVQSSFINFYSKMQNILPH